MDTRSTKTASSEPEKKCIIIFTKDRPSTLLESLRHLRNIKIDIIILDDSVYRQIKMYVNSHYKINNIFFHDKHKQRVILQNLRDLNIDAFVKHLSVKGWNLGFARNYAIILSKVLGYKKVIFMDDDIIVRDDDIIVNIMEKLNEVDFVGAKISGMPDNSLLGHIIRACNIEEEEFLSAGFLLQTINSEKKLRTIKPYELLSGGFLAFNLDAVSEYFFNYYNEDWIWLFLHGPKTKGINYGKVYQLPYDPFQNAVEKAMFQEFGEILVDGVYTALKERRNFSQLIYKSFWKGILEKRFIDIKKLAELCKGNEIEYITLDVCKALLKYYSKAGPDIFAKVFTAYFEQRAGWLFILEKLNTEDYAKSL